VDRSGAHPLIKLAVSANNTQVWSVYTDTAAPVLGDNSGLLGLSANDSACAAENIAYYESISHALRLATWTGLQWTDQRVDGGAGLDVGQHVSLAVDQSTCRPAMAYVAPADDGHHSEIRYAFWRDGWLTQTVDTNRLNVTDLSLSLATGSDEYPRIAYTDSQTNKLLLSLPLTKTLPVRNATWQQDTVLQTGSVANSHLDLQVRTRDHLAFSQPSAGVLYIASHATEQLPPDYNPLQPCLEVVRPDYSSLGSTLARVRALSPAALSQVDDLNTLRALRDLFALSAEGRHYIDLYYQYAPETGALALANPALLWDSYRTLQNFLPGFRALAADHGDSIVITQAMVDQANNIADRLVAAGSPALAVAINVERGKYYHLQTFVGKTFAEAAALLGVAVYRNYLPLVHR
jgi:hypothetical protein